MPGEGMVGRILGPNMIEEFNKRTKAITDSLVPIMEKLVSEQEKTNKLLYEIKEELGKIYRNMK
jgi:hypothetical protein